MDNLFGALRHAADNLRTVAHSLHIPLDTSAFDQALAALEDGLKPKRGPKSE